MEEWVKAFRAPYGSNGNQRDSRKRVVGNGPPSGVTNPKCTPRGFTFTDGFAIQKIVSRFVLPAGEGGATGTFTPQILVYTPSVRLRVRVTLAFEADNQSATDPTFQVGNVPGWTITPMQRNPETGRETALQVVYPSTGTQNLPDGYEFDSAAELLRIAIQNLKDTSLAASYVPNTARCNLIFCARWEPNLEMTNEERDQLYAKCAVTFGQPILIQNNAV